MNKQKPKSALPLDKLVAELNTQLSAGFGGRVFLGGEIEEASKERRSWGIPALDYITNGGLPKGGLVEIGGEYSSGKTTTTIHACATAQRKEPHLAIGWVSLEPFSKRWARTNGLWLPFNRDNDKYEDASELELLRMEQLGITDPYEDNGLGRVVLVRDERGDAALDVAVTMLKSNLFSIIVVDSFGVAKNTTWVEDKDVQASSDFPREPKMLSDYTARCLLALNRRYDENNVPSRDGKNTLQTTMIHLNQIGMAIGTQAYAPWKKYNMKGGEGVKHNHHIIVFLWKGDALSEKVGSETIHYAQRTKAITIKNKWGMPWLQSDYDLYYRDFDVFRQGDINVARSALTLGVMAGVVERTGAWYQIGEDRFQGQKPVEEFLREQPAILEWLIEESVAELSKRT